ncbi:MAG: DUF1622 domain-containing protein [Clostridia bacterium]
MEVFDMIFNKIIQICIYLMEIFGVAILVFTAIKSFLSWIKKDMHMRLELAKGITLALEFKMGGEVLRTVIVNDWSELAILGAIILLRGLLVILVNWEISNEEKRLKSHFESIATPISEVEERVGNEDTDAT